MQFLYANSSKQAPLENFLTSSGTNTELDQFFLKPGASRTLAIPAVRVQGKGGGLTALSGLVIRMKQWTTTASASTTTAASGSTSTTPVPKNKLAPACVATAGMVTTSSVGVNPGTGGGNYVGLASMGASGPGGWVSINPDDVPTLDGGTNMSLDLVSSCPTASLSWEFELDNQEG
jgi:hypothetical protein